MADLTTADPEPDTAPAAAAAEPAPARPPTPRHSRWSATMAALAVVLAALSAATVALLVAGEDPVARQRGPALEVARKVALDLTSMGAANAEARLAALDGSATPGFRDELNGYRQLLQAALVQQQVTAEARLGAAGLEHIDESSAVALVAVTATVRDVEFPDGQERRYRLAIGLERADGRWLVSSVGFVP